MSLEKNNQQKSGNQKMTFEIPAEGALGLLALGATGVKAWKEAKRLHAEKQAEEENRNKNESNEGKPTE